MFGLDDDGVDGRFLDPICCNPADPHHVSNQLLRWHFRQAVLANVRGAGEPIFEHDFTGEDMIGPSAGNRTGRKGLSWSCPLD